MPSDKEIQRWMRKVDASSLSINAFFALHGDEIPFSRAQYFVYRRVMTAGHEFKKPRGRGGNRKLGEREEMFLKGVATRDPLPSVGELAAMLKSQLGTDVRPTAIRRALDRLLPRRIRPRAGRPRKQAPATFVNPLGGFELIVAVAYLLDWPARVETVIREAVRDRKKGLRSGKTTLDDSEGRRGGRFTKRYNSRSDVRSRRFASVAEKRETKKWESMNIMNDTAAVIARKSVALLSLPVLTNNGAVRNFDRAPGDSLRHLCGFDYKRATITKFLADLKYLSVAERLLRDLPNFWQICWGEDVSKAAGPLLCYYVDGNTKPVWSSKRIKQSNVTMLGRVMGCLEAVFIHDGLGHPVYFETYSGHAPVGEYILGLFDKIDNAIMEVPGSRTRVCRAIVMDSASNSVKTLRAFAAQDKYHYITSLDDNQCSPRRICERTYPVPYRYGKATLRDTRIELTDSKDPDKYLIAPRTIIIDWATTTKRAARRTVLVTSVPKEIADASQVVQAYFRRWPAEELWFKAAKASVSLNRVCGYGRLLVTNDRVKEEVSKLDAKKKTLEEELNAAFGEIDLHERALVNLIPREARLRQKTKVKDGKRHVPRAIREEFEAIGAKIQHHEAAKKRIQTENRAAFKRYHKTRGEWSRLQHKMTVYRLDVELDQIMTYFRATLAHLCAYFLKNFLGGEPMELEMLFYRMNRLPANVEETRHTRNVSLAANPKDLEMTNLLRPAIDKLNAAKIRGPRGRVYHFALT